MKILTFLFTLCVLFLAACAPPAKPLCETPYVFIDSACCMDTNNDGICDPEEEQIPAVPEAQEVRTSVNEEWKDAPLRTDSITEPPQSEQTQNEETPTQIPVPSKDFVEGATSIDRTAVLPKQEKSLTLKDFMYEYRTRRYYYTDETFGVTEPFYKGNAPPISAPDSVEIHVLGIDIHPEASVDLKFNEYKTGVEHAGYLMVGDSYVTKSGIKITIDAIKANMFDFTLERVPPTEHTEYCDKCIREPIALSTYDDGVKVAEIGTTESYSILGKSYTIDLLSIDEKQRPKFQVKPGDHPTEVLPLLRSGDVFVLSNGIGLKYLFGHLNNVVADKATGYAVFGFVETPELPLSALCPECVDFVSLEDGETTEVLMGGKKRVFHLNAQEDSVLLTIDNVQAKLTDKLTRVSPDTFAALLKNDPYIVGVSYKGGVPPQLYCRETMDVGHDPETVGKIRYAIGSTQYLVEKSDTCVNSFTLAEYSCAPIPGRDTQASSGKGFAPQVTYVDCECFSVGVCA